MPWLNSSGSTSDETQAGEPASPCDLCLCVTLMILHVKPRVPLGLPEPPVGPAAGGGPLCGTYQTPGQGTSLESGQWPSNALSHSSTASWCTGQGGPQHSGPQSEQRNTSQSAGLQRGRGEGDTFTTCYHHTLGQVLSACSQWCLFWLSNVPV